jgi:hypothetical protein
MATAKIDVLLADVEANVMSVGDEKWLDGDPQESSAATNVQGGNIRVVLEVKTDQRLKDADDMGPFSVGEFPSSTMLSIGNQTYVLSAPDLFAIDGNEHTLKQLIKTRFSRLEAAP